MILSIFQMSITFCVLYLLYILVFSKFTFHSINRLVLVALLPLSILLPWMAKLLPYSMTTAIIEIPPLFEIIEKNTTATPLFISQTSYGTINYKYILNVLLIIYCFGVFIRVFKFYKSMLGLIRLKKNSIRVKKSDHTLVKTNVTTIFSYFQWVFIPVDKMYDPLIIAHEKAHIRLGHTLDLIITELYITVFWFNPIVYLYRKSLKSVHEFQADALVLKKEIKTSHYLELVLQSLEIKNTDQLYSYFNTPILKKRINMMTKSTSHTYLKLTYILLVPICALFIFAFTKQPTASVSFSDTLQLFEPSIQSPTFLFPIKNSYSNNITASFHAEVKDPKSKKIKTHTGIDIRAIIGTPIIATADGVVSVASNKGAWGNLIVITHDQEYETWYAHLKSFTIKEKQYVSKGDIIGYVGMTGNTSGPHLHYELKQHAISLDPISYFENE